MVASFKISSFHKKQVLDCGLLQQAGPLCAQRPNSHAELKFCRVHLLVGMQSQALRPSRFRDSCALLRRIKKAFYKKRAACIRRMRFKGLGFPNKHFATQNGRCIYEGPACYGYERLLNCKTIF